MKRVLFGLGGNSMRSLIMRAPPPTLRLIAPIVVASTVVVFASGVALLLLGPSSRGSLLLIHKASLSSG